MTSGDVLAAVVLADVGGRTRQIAEARPGATSVTIESLDGVTSLQVGFVASSGQLIESTAASIAASARTFAHVPAGVYFDQAVAWMVASQITTGTGP